MEVKNTLARNIEAADAEKASLDAACKNLLSDKNILAWILKSCVEEYKDCSIQEIMEKYIEGTPEVSYAAVHRDENNTRSELVNGERNEDNSITEGRVTYDIKFKALHPYTAMDERKKNVIKDLEECFTMIINVESQSDFYPGYPILKRGIYYGGRMISSQYGTVFTNSHYEKLQKVVSIWICLNPPKYRENSINLYSLQERQLLGAVKEKKENYDLMTVAMVCLKQSETENDVDDRHEWDEKEELQDEGSEDLIRLLSLLLSTKIKADDKKRILETEFNIAMTKKMEKEANDMCDFGRYVEEQATRRGMQKGIQQGESMLSALMNRLFMDGRTEDAMLAVRDEDTRKRLYREYGIAVQ